MSAFAALFFARLGRAGFYRALHAEAVARLGAGGGRTWLDVGCGPGLVARLAAERGWRARGLDLDPAMIARAGRLGGAGDLGFAVGSLDDLAPGSATVVSAASLLIGLADRRSAVAGLLSALTPDGVLLVVETTPAMRPAAAWARIRRGDLGRDAWLLLLWSLARRRARPVGVDDLAQPGFHLERTELLDGLAAAWALRRTQTPRRDPPSREDVEECHLKVA
ncbi:MAG: class I SAM-dependent methyltransferase [Hyphomicrobiales bacterium]|nr:class I SAM-dependent methyltransferase [Hyphomicrobiales bacterium]